MGLMKNRSATEVETEVSSGVSGLRLVLVILVLSGGALFLLPQRPDVDRAIVAAREAVPMAAAANGILAIAGWRLHAVTTAGALTGAAIGTTIVVGSGWRIWCLLVVMFAMVVAATQTGRRRKAALGIEEPRRGRRGPGNALANTGLAAGAAAVHLITGSELAQVWAIASLVTSGSDTVASEIGKAYGHPTWHPLQGRRVPPGTTGGISVVGTLAAAVSAAALSILAMQLQWIDAVTAGGTVFAALVAGVIEGVVSEPLESRGLLNNDDLNLLNGALGAALAVTWVLAVSG
jgi:uncharacterized protein (TIGR00297 family)